MKSAVALLVAIVLLIAGGVLVAYLIQNVAADEPTWQRYTYLLTGVEAVVFAAVGWLFGREVHREQAANAEKARTEADKDKQDAVAAAAVADTKGRELARAIISAGGGSEGPDRIVPANDVSMGQLVRHAKSAYPDV
jgi:hypothetical protein